MARKLNLQAVSSLFAVQFSERSGLVKDVKAAESVLREYETATTTHSFFNADMAAKKHKVLWEDSGLPFDNVPFVVVNHKVYDCQHGVDRHLCEKKRNQAVGFY